MPFVPVGFRPQRRRAWVPASRRRLGDGVGGERGELAYFRPGVIRVVDGFGLVEFLTNWPRESW